MGEASIHHTHTHLPAPHSAIQARVASSYLETAPGALFMTGLTYTLNV